MIVLPTLPLPVPFLPLTPPADEASSSSLAACLAANSSLPASCSSSGRGPTSPKIVTRALARPLHPGISTTRQALGSSRRLRVCMASGLRLKMGKPAPSEAKSTRVAKG